MTAHDVDSTPLHIHLASRGGIDVVAHSLRRPLMLAEVIAECAALERLCWEPIQPFASYAESRDVLVTASRGGRILAFAMGRFDIEGERILVHEDECMVHPEARDLGLSGWVGFMALDCLLTMVRVAAPEARRIMCLGHTVNPKLVGLAWRYRWCFSRTNLDPGSGLEAVAFEQLREIGGLTLVEGCPWFVRGSNETGAPRPYRWPRDPEVRRWFPETFDPQQGHSILLLGEVAVPMLRTVFSLLYLRWFGLAGARVPGRVMQLARSHASDRERRVGLSFGV